jgi:hypothetical protein
MPVRDHFRAHARRRVDLGALLRGAGGDAATESTRAQAEVRIRDLGLGGACLELAETGGVPLDRESPIAIEVVAPSLWDPLRLRGKVAWLRRGGPGRSTRVGMRFEHRDASALYALYQLLSAYVFDE